MVILDPGHGGADAGASGVRSSALEKNIVLELAVQLGKLLQTEGNVAVALTRNSDMSLDPVQRAEIANYSQGTLLVSLHAGASGNPESSGARVFFFADYPLKDSLAQNVPAEERSAASKSSRLSRTPALRLVPWEKAHEPFDAASNRLASSLQGTLNALFDAQYEACPAPIYLLKSAQMPAVLVEIGYLTNKEDDDRLQVPGFLKGLAHAIQNGITNYLTFSRRMNRIER